MGLFFTNSLDLYFKVEESGEVLLNTKKDGLIENAVENTDSITLNVDVAKDDIRKKIKQEPAPTPKWQGGFMESVHEFEYPEPKLESLSFLGNLDNIDKLDRQMSVLWPEFSWPTRPGEDDIKRCFQMFAHDISRIGYTVEGKVYSIICPQQGYCIPIVGGCINVEITVTGNRGWVDEATKTLAADLTVVAKIWFSQTAKKHSKLSKWAAHKLADTKLPFSKETAITISTCNKDDTTCTFFSLRKGETEEFITPAFARHCGISHGVGHLSAQIGEMNKTGSEIADNFNLIVLDIFNALSGNMLKKDNVLTWNVWFSAPEAVDQDEWNAHAELWRHSIQAEHGSPGGRGTSPRFEDGTKFNAKEDFIKKEFKKLSKLLKVSGS